MGARARTDNDYFGVHHSGGIERIDARGRR
jgi:hypothetical protein